MSGEILTVRGLESRIRDLREDITHAVTARDFVSAGQLQAKLKQAEKQHQDLLSQPPPVDQHGIGPTQTSNIRQIENECHQIEQQMKEAVDRRDFVEAGAKQKELTNKKEQLEAAKQQLQKEQQKLTSGPALSESPGKNVRQLQSECNGLKKEMKDAVANRNFVLAGQKQKELNDKNKELEKAKLQIVLPVGPNIRQLERERDLLEKEMKEAVAQRSFVIAGTKQKLFNEKTQEIERAKSGGGGMVAPPGPNIRQLEQEIEQIKQKMKEAANNSDFVLAGEKQKELKDKLLELEKAKGGSQMPELPTVNIRQLENECKEAEKEMKEAVSKKDFVLAGKKQQQWTDKKKELENAKAGKSSGQIQISQPEPIIQQPSGGRFQETDNQQLEEINIEKVDETYYNLVLEAEKLNKNMCTDRGDYQLQEKLRNNQSRMEAVSQILLDKRTKYLEDIYVTDMKQDWELEDADKALDLSKLFKKANGSYSVSLGIDKTKRAEIPTPRMFYVMSSTTHTYHKLEVKYKQNMIEEARSPYLTNVEGGGSG